MAKIEIPILAPEEKYQALYSFLYNYITSSALLTAQKYGPEVIEIFIKTMEIVAERMSKKFIKRFNLKESIEDSLKLLGLYNNELLGSEDGYAILEDENKGYYILPTCTWYNKFFAPYKIPCDKNCSEYEYPALIKPLSANLKITLIESLARGDNYCKFEVKKIK